MNLNDVKWFYTMVKLDSTDSWVLFQTIECEIKEIRTLFGPFFMEKNLYEIIHIIISEKKYLWPCSASPMGVEGISELPCKFGNGITTLQVG